MQAISSQNLINSYSCNENKFSNSLILDIKNSSLKIHVQFMIIHVAPQAEKVNPAFFPRFALKASPTSPSDSRPLSRGSKSREAIFFVRADTGVCPYAWDAVEGRMRREEPSLTPFPYQGNSNILICARLFVPLTFGRR